MARRPQTRLRLLRFNVWSRAVRFWCWSAREAKNRHTHTLLVLERKLRTGSESGEIWGLSIRSF